MTLIDQIIAKVQETLIDENGNLTLKSSDFDVDFMDAFFTKLLKVESLTLTQAVKTSDSNSITVIGSADFLEYTNLALSIVFNVQDDEVVGTVTGTFPPSHTITLPVITWIEVGNIVLTTSISQTFELITHAFKVDILVQGSSTTIPIEIQSQPGSEWRLDIADGTEHGITGDELVSLLSGNALNSFMPQPLVSILNGFKINGIEAIFDTEQETVYYFSTGVSVTNGWDLAPKVSLKPGLQINLTLINPTDPDRRVVAGNVNGTFDINGVELPILLGATIGSMSLWSFGLQPGQTIILPSFSNLLGLAGGQDFLATLPPGLSNIPQIEIDTLQVDFDPDQKELTRLSFSIQTASSWSIISGYFQMDRLLVAFDITNLTESSNRTILGRVRSIFKIGSVPVLCDIEKTEANPNWTIIGGLPPQKTVSITQISVGLFEGKITMPEGIPNISFSVLKITVVPSQRSFSFSAQSADEWPIVNQLSIETFDLNFTRDPSQANNPITGHIASTLEIANVTLSLLASLNETPGGGWQFEGSTGTGQEIPIGTLIEDLARTFDVTQEFPSAIEGLVIENLKTSFNTKTKNFTFICKAEFPIEGKEVSITVNINIIQQQDGSYNKHFAGYIIIGDLQFALIFDTDQTSKTFLAAYHDEHTVKIKDLIGYIDPTLKDEIPEGLEISLKDALFAYSQKEIASSKTTNFLFGLNIGGGINLSKLPLVSKLVSKEFPPNQTIKLSFQILVAKAIFTSADISNLNKLYTEGGISLPEGKELAKGLDLATSMQLGSETRQLSLPVQVNPNATNQDNALTEKEPEQGSSSPSSPASPNEINSPDSTKWYKLQKTFGPVHFERVGLNYKDSKIWFLLDAELSAAGLTISLDGLSVNSPLTKIDPKFDLKGIGIDYQSGSALEIGGAFLRKQGTTPDGETYDEYDGAAVIKSETFTLSAIGSYTQYDGHPSLFIYAVLDYPLGGPSFFFVTGLAAGFGYNRALKIPTIDQVVTFPLVEEAIHSNNSSSNTQDGATKLTQELNKLQEYIPPETGQIFLAVGVKFTSFKIIDSFALLTVAFGNRFEVNLLGLSTLIAPPEVDKTPVAEVQLALKATFLPDEGFLGVRAQLTPNSYVLSKKCHLTGGFAFYSWFAPHEHDGDFVLTLGGYHPKFNVPAHYPRVPRLAFNWQVNSQLNIKADGYFAITASALMAGGHLQATWQSGRLKAWFNAGADFLIAWKPYHYDARIYVDMGVSYSFHVLFATVHISVDVGADLHIWGPEFTGKAHIHLWIVSFTVNFGADAAQTPKAIDWNTFKSSFLPADDDICSIVVKDGLVRKVNQDDKLDLGVINPKHFCLVTNSVIPSNKVSIKNNDNTILDGMKEEKNNIYYEDDKHIKIKPFIFPSYGEKNLIHDIKALMVSYSIAHEDSDTKENLLNKIIHHNEVEVEVEVDLIKDIRTLMDKYPIVYKTSDTKEDLLEKIENVFKYPKAIASPGIGSMEVKSGELTTTTTITITRDGKNAEEDFAYIPILKKAPTGLWGESLKPDLNDKQFIENTLSGFEIKPKKQHEPGKSHDIDRKNLQFSTESINNAYKWENIPPFIAETNQKQTINDTIMEKSTIDERKTLLRQMGINAEEINLSQSIAEDFLISPQIEEVAVT